MTNARLLGASHADDVVLSATSAATGFPVTNLQTTDVQATWRSTGTGDQTISGTFAATKTVSAVHLENVNFSGSETLTLELSDDGFATTKLSQTFNKWSKDLTYAAATLFVTPTTATDFRVVVSDSGNADGYVEVGRLKLGAYFDLPNSLNVDTGPSFGYTERGALQQTRGGRLVSDNKTPLRQISVRWGAVKDSDAWDIDADSVAEILEHIGQRDDVLLSVYPGGGDDRERRHTILGRITDLKPIQGRFVASEGGSAILHSQWQMVLTEAI